MLEIYTIHGNRDGSLFHGKVPGRSKHETLFNKRYPEALYPHNRIFPIAFLTLSKISAIAAFNSTPEG